MKKLVFLSFALLLVATTLQAQLSGEFYHANDGHYYFRALNSQNTSGTIKITAISYYNDVEREDYRTIRGYGDGFILGPTTPWKWYWHEGDRLYITYPDGSSVYWECPYTEDRSNVSFHQEKKHCTYTVGCDCKGFKPKSTIGPGRFICDRCGHEKKYHPGAK